MTRFNFDPRTIYSKQFTFPGSKEKRSGLKFPDEKVSQALVTLNYQGTPMELKTDSELLILSTLFEVNLLFCCHFSSVLLQFYGFVY